MKWNDSRSGFACSVLVATALLLSLGCNGDKPGAKAPLPSEKISSNKNDSTTKTKAPKMTNTDPASPEAWKQAEAIAKTVAHGDLEKRSDALPFMFMADMPPAVLVHKGAVVSDKGPVAAGAYLRDLGVVSGQGPKIDDVLFVLFAFNAWPEVTEKNNQAFINTTAGGMKELSPAIEFDGEEARVVLHYQVPGKATGDNGSAPASAQGAPDPDFKQTETREVERCTLHIPEQGESAWKVQKLNWAMTE